MPMSRLHVLSRFFNRRTPAKCVVKCAFASTSATTAAKVTVGDQSYSAVNDDGEIPEKLEVFFDKRESWGTDGDLQESMRPGRSWTKDELRFKSNVDLHKLWFVLLKERNMLMTMKRIYDRAYVSFPNPERSDRVDESMAALEAVVDERNRAYSLLETGTTGERPTRRITTMAGFVVEEPLDEHLTPPGASDKRYETPELNDDVDMFQKLWAEEEWQRKQHERDDAMSLEGKHRLKYRNEREVQVFHDYHPDNKGNQ